MSSDYKNGLRKQLGLQLSRSLFIGVVTGCFIYKLAILFLSNIVISDNSPIFDIIMLLSCMSGVASGLLYFLVGINRYISYIEVLEKAVSKIAEDNYSEQIPVTGNNELGILAKGMDEMRIHLLESREHEQQMRNAQRKMVRGMSHDLRTPLTALLSTIDILLTRSKDSKDQEYLKTAYDETLQLRNLSDQMFEYFLLDTDETTVITIIQASELKEEYLSLMVMLLEPLGYQVKIEDALDDRLMVYLNHDYMARVINNLISNITKYALQELPIEISILDDPEFVRMIVRNHITNNPNGKSTGIGLENVSIMMKKMKGLIKTNQADGIFVTELCFRKADLNEKSEAFDN